MPTETGLENLRKLVDPWHAGPRQELADTRILTLHSQQFTSATDPGRSGDFALIDTRDFMNVLAITPDNHVVMVEQFRFGSGTVTLEPPAGIVEPGEDPMVTCARELAEETGYASEREVEPMGSVYTNPAIMNNRCWFGVIRDAEPIAERHLDEHEEIAVRLVPVMELERLIDDGLIDHALSVACIERFLRREARR